MKPPTSPSPRRPPVGTLIAAIGFGFAIWYGWEWYRLPVWTEAEIGQSVELNLALDRSRHTGPAPSDDEMRRLRQQVDDEVRTEISADRDQLRSYALTGLVVGMIGVAQMGIWRILNRR